MRKIPGLRRAHRPDAVCYLCWLVLVNSLCDGLTRTLLAVNGEPTESITVVTKYGQVRGLVVEEEGRMMSEFLGVPYAKPPVDELRLARPVRHPGWWSAGDPWDATYYRPGCPHDAYSWLNRTTGASGGSSQQLVDEDCLYLNLYVPQNLSDVQHVNTLGLPVMVYLHDGGFCAEAPTLYGGRVLASHGNVIVAAVQYRVGVLGFYSAHTPEGGNQTSGNFGLLDQRLGLQWIWDNVREFGGDPSRVTLFGQGSGGTSVIYHVLSPLSRGVFTGAIVQSASCWRMCALQQASDDVSSMLARMLKCPSGDLDLEQTLSCLRQVSLVQLLQSAKDIRSREESGSSGSWLPVVDNYIILADPVSSLRAGKHNPATIIIGISNYIASSQRRTLLSAISSSHSVLDLSQGISQEQFEAAVSANVHKCVWNNAGFTSDAAVLEYSPCSAASSRSRAQALASFLLDFRQLAPSDLLARLVSRGAGSNPVYMYVVRRGLRVQGGAVSLLGEAAAGVSLGSVQETDLLLGGQGAGSPLHNTLLNAWANFANTRDPNPVNDRGAAWHPYTPENRYYLHFDPWVNSSCLQRDHRARQTTFWNEYAEAVQSDKHTCSSAGACGVRLNALQYNQVAMSSTTYTLTGVCLLLLVVVVVLAAKLCGCGCCYWRHDCCHGVASSSRGCYHCCQPAEGDKLDPHMEGETRKLHPLPYREEA